MTFAKKMQRIAQKKWIFFGCLQKKRYLCTRIRKDAGVVDRAALEMRCTGNCTGGSNPSLSANDKKERGLQISLFFLLKKRESRRRGMRTRRGFVIDEVAFETKWRKNPSLSANDKKERGLQISLFFLLKKRESRRRGMRTRRGFVIDEVAFETKWRKNPSLSANNKKERGLQISLFFYTLPTNYTLLYICASFSSV